MNNLFSEFNSSTKEEWLAKVEKDLKGKPLEALNWELTKDLNLSPFAHADDLREVPTPIAATKKNNSWEIGVQLPVEEITDANQAALQALAGGATAIAFSIDRSLDQSEIAALLKDIQLEWISIHFIFQIPTWKRFANNFLDYIKSIGSDPNKVHCSFSFRGNLTDTEGERKMLQSLQQALPQAKLFTIDGQRFYKGKEHTVQELAQILKAGNSILEQLNQEDLGIAVFQQTLQFALTLGDSYFINIAKLRAFKLLWQQVLQAWDASLSNLPIIEIHLGLKSQTGEANYNKIKATTQALSAVIGGVQRLYIYPSDISKEDWGSDFARRIAWNVQHLLQLESYMDRVIDPAAGSYYIEALTNRFAEAAWGDFQKNCT